MSIKDLVKAKETTIYTSPKGCVSSKGGLMAKVGEVFLDPCPADVELLEYFVSIGIAEKIVKSLD